MQHRVVLPHKFPANTLWAWRIHHHCLDILNLLKCFQNNPIKTLYRINSIKKWQTSSMRAEGLQHRAVFDILQMQSSITSYISGETLPNVARNVTICLKKCHLKKIMSSLASKRTEPGRQHSGTLLLNLKNRQMYPLSLHKSLDSVHSYMQNIVHKHVHKHVQVYGILEYCIFADVVLSQRHSC